VSLKLYYHPLASFCWKPLIALYESDTPFEGRIVDLMDPVTAGAFKELWPIGKFPVLRDDARDRTIPESMRRSPISSSFLSSAEGEGASRVPMRLSCSGRRDRGPLGGPEP
jgi:hypothetical protein